MKKPKVVILLLFIFVLIGIIFIPYAQFTREQQKEHKRVLENGRNLVGILCLSSAANFQSKVNDSFFKQLSQSTSTEGLVYCIIHNKDKEPVISFAPGGIQTMVPPAVTNKSLYAYGFIMQDFTLNNGGEIIEFAKPVFKNGELFSIVRLGLKLSHTKYFTTENLVLPAQIAFFILLALIFGYYWTILSFKNIHQKLDACEGVQVLGEEKNTDIKNIIGDLTFYLNTMDEKFALVESEKQQLESGLKINQFEINQLLNIFNAFDFGLMFLDSRDLVFFINTYFLDLLGKENFDVIDHPLKQFIEHEELRSYIQQHSLTEQRRNSNKMELTFPETQPGQFYLASISNIKDAEGSVSVKSVMIQNVAKEKEAEKSRQDFVNHIAHELRTPLTNIKAYNEMMMDGEISNIEMQKEFFNTINDETNRLAKLISSILELAETEIGQLTAKKDMVKTDWVMKSSLDAVDAFAREKNITIQTEFPDNFPKISGDKEMLKSALINVLGNALKYTRDNGTVTFGLKEIGDMAVFEIVDTGYGIDDNDLPHIFEKFYRSDNDFVFNQEGSGLGLAITSEIIKIHDGFIEVQSELDKGSRFTIKIPKGDLLIG